MSEWFADPPVYAALKSTTADRYVALQAAIAAGGDPNAADYRGYVPLGCSAVRKDPRLMTVLLQAGADPNAMHRDNHLIASAVSLMRATRGKEQVASLIDFIRRLMAAGADPVWGSMGRQNSALWLAIQFGWCDLLAVLLEGGADPKLTNEQGQSALDWAIACERPEAARLIGGEKVSERVAMEIPDPSVSVLTDRIATLIKTQDHVLNVRRPGFKGEYEIHYEFFFHKGGFAHLKWDEYGDEDLNQASMHHLGDRPDRLVKAIVQQLGLHQSLYRPRRETWQQLLEQVAPRNARNLSSRRFGA